MSVWFVLASYPSIHVQPSVLISVAIGHSVSLKRMCYICIVQVMELNYSQHEFCSHVFKCLERRKITPLQQDEGRGLPGFVATVALKCTAHVGSLNMAR